MFRKIVSNLPFSPALVGQLGVYSKRLRKEKNIRRLSLIFLFMALIVQLFVILQPPVAVNAYINNPAIEPQTQDNIIKTIKATNSSQGYIDASSVIASAGDQISYTIALKNTDTLPQSTKITESTLDILDYATIIDNGGGTVDKTSGTISWPDAKIDPSSQQTRTFTTRLLDPIPANARGKTDTKSYDCVISATFGSTVNVNVDCPSIKAIEGVVSELPTVKPTVSMSIAVITLIVTAFFYARARLLEKEIRLIRKDASTGTL